MATFDVETFLALKGQGKGTFTAVGATFGMPSCMTELGANVMKLLPSSILRDLQGRALSSGNKADEVLKKFFKKVSLMTSIIENFSDDGSIQYISDASEFGIDANEALTKNRGSGWFSALSTAANTGAQLYRNFQVGKAQIEDIKDCFEKYDQILSFSGGEAVNERAALEAVQQGKAYEIIQNRFKSEKEAADSAVQFLGDLETFTKNIQDTLVARDADPSLEPEFTPDWSDLSGFGFKVASEDDPEEEPDEIFRLIFGPPQSSEGSFLLSQDGLYFDSQSSGIIPALASLASKRSDIPIEEQWKLDFDPNIGGRGVTITGDDLVDYVGTLFDPDIIDESSQIREFYTADRLLNAIVGQKDKKIHDLSAQISAYESSGISTAIVTNTRQNLVSEAALYDDKIRKRKKQIEIAVKAPVLYGNGAVFEKGEIPINDFGYLKDINLGIAIQKQRRLVLDSDDVSGVVSPLPVKFVYSPTTDREDTANHLYVPYVGIGSILADTQDPNVVSGTELSITDVVVTDKLVAMYNFLQSDVVPYNSNKFLTVNDASEKGEGFAQLVAPHASSVFVSGVSVPRLEGIAHRSSVDTDQPSSTASYVRLPDSTTFQDFMYSQEGFSFDFWVHLPEFNSVNGFENNGASGLYRLVLANENTGLTANIEPQDSYNSMELDRSSDVTRGFIMGFTRDRRITKGDLPSNEFDANLPASSLAFFMAPTQSYDASTVGFVRRKVDGECSDADGWYCMKVDSSTTVNSVSFNDICQGYVHVAVTVNVRENECKIYLDNNLMATSSVESVFGTERTHPVNLPSFKKNNSFEWQNYGPKLDSFFTPWVIGGGYTDGLAASGGFMGGDFGGKVSGLRGNLGSIKFYTKALLPSEVNKNYSAQQILFKNILVQNTCWEAIE